MSLAPTDLVSAHRWERVTFTTWMRHPRGKIN